MASTTTTAFLSILFLFTYSATSRPPTSSSAIICQSTPYPSVCQKYLPINNSSATIYDYARLSIHKSNSTASKFANLIDRCLSNSAGLTTRTIAALQDCRFFAGFNLEFLSAAFEIVNDTQTIYRTAEYLPTILSTVLTNTETCIGGLQDAASWSSKNSVVARIKEDNKLYSVALALVNKMRM